MARSDHPFFTCNFHLGYTTCAIDGCRELTRAVEYTLASLASSMLNEHREEFASSEVASALCFHPEDLWAVSAFPKQPTCALQVEDSYNCTD